MKYKPEQEVELRVAYEAAETDAQRKAVVESFSQKLKVSKHSVIGKLSSMGVYQKPAPLTKSGDPIIAKQEYVQAIRIMLSAKGEELESLEKASKRDLKIIMDKLITMSESVNLNKTKCDLVNDFIHS